MFRCVGSPRLGKDGTVDPVDSPIDGTAVDWRRLLDAFPSAAAIVDAGFVLLEVNDAMCLLLRAQRDNLIGTRPAAAGLGEGPVRGGDGAATLRRIDGSVVEVFCTATDFAAERYLVQFRETPIPAARDTTALTEVKADRYGAEATFEAVFENAPIGIALVGLDGSFLRANEALCGITGYPEHELTKLTFQDITHPDDLDSDLNEATRLLHGEIPSYHMDKRYYCKDGHLVWIRLSGSLVRDADGQPVNFIAHIEDISARKRDEELLRRRATRDALTGVFNRSRFEEELARHLALASGHGYEGEAAVLMIDVDGLKRVNDEEGHAAGDAYLIGVAQAISRRLRLSDVFARIGGDEFAVLLPNTPVAQAQKLADTLSEQVQTQTRGSVSIGIGMITPRQLDGVLERADDAMYRAKKLGPGHCCGP